MLRLKWAGLRYAGINSFSFFKKEEHSIHFCLFFSPLVTTENIFLCLFFMHVKEILTTASLVKNIVNNDKDKQVILSKQSSIFLHVLWENTLMCDIWRLVMTNGNGNNLYTRKSTHLLLISFCLLENLNMREKKSWGTRLL